VKPHLHSWNLVLLAALLAMAVVAVPVRAQEPPPIRVASSTVTYTFGQQATFELEASAPAGVTAAYLYLQQAREKRVEVHPVSVDPRTTVRIRYEHDLHLFPFPPFGLVRWWWEVRDAEGHSLTTEPAAFYYADNRFQWKTSTAGPVRVHSVVDDPVYIQAALNVTQASLENIREQLDAPMPERVDLYLYPSADDIRAALEMAGREWAGGEAMPDLGVILVAVPPNRGILPRMERDIPHELTHLLVYQVMGERGYQYIPAWLDEGLATANELQPDPMLDVLLEEAQRQGRLIPLSELCAPFPPDPEIALLSYAESASVVRYIQKRYGDSGIQALLATYADGAGCEGGVQRALGISLQRLELAWHADLMGLGAWLAWASDNRGWLALWAISLLAAVPMALSLRRNSGSATHKETP